jgi:hypothetical protein
MVGFEVNICCALKPLDLVNFSSRREVEPGTITEDFEGSDYLNWINYWRYAYDFFFMSFGH